VPRARPITAEGKTTEWKREALWAYQRRTLAADALVAIVSKVSDSALKKRCFYDRL